MGDWRRVQIIGTCAAQDVPSLRANLDPGKDYRNFHCLVCGGIAGLPNWASETISVVGNLAERGYDAESVAEQLVELAKRSPSLAVKVHVGDNNESAVVVNTVTLAGGNATIGPPEQEMVPELDGAQMRRNLAAQLQR